MKESTMEALSLEPERYELHGELSHDWEIARREFFDFAGNGLVVVFALDQVSAIHEGSGRRAGPALSLPQEIGVWLHIDENGSTTAYAGKVEVGQNIRTSLAQIITEELPVSLDSIHIVLGDTDLTPFDFGTVGSRTTPITAPQLRKAAAAAREALLDIAAQKMGVLRAVLSFGDGQVVHSETGQTLHIGELVRGQQLLRVAEVETQTKTATQWQSDTLPLPKLNAHDFITGKHRYTSDFKRSGMGYGKVLRAPSNTAQRVSLDASALDDLPDVTFVQDGDFIGVVASDELSATRALDAIRVEWQLLENGPSSRTVFDYLKAHPSEVQSSGGTSTHSEGSVAQGLARADHVLHSSYTVAYIAHVPLEPRAAVAEWEGESEKSKLTVWTGTQRPFGVRTELAEALGLSEDHVRVIVPDTGSGYGGKHTGDAAIEAARLARIAKRPVKLVWTRPEEFKHAYLRPSGVIDIHSGIAHDGTLVAWEHHNINSGASAMRTLYRVPNQHIEFHAAQSPLRQGSYRALAATANHFARETHMDELAHAVGLDPLALRLHNLDDSRLRDVLEAAAERFGWNATQAEKNHGFGIAGGHEKGSYVATCAEVRVNPEDGQVKVVRVVTAFECGAIINADNVQAQVEGALIMGLGGALFEEIDFENGHIHSDRFSRYRLPRFSDLPVFDTVLLDRKDLPSVGAGETPIVAMAPAIGNAIFAATGVRLRSMPLAPNGVPLNHSSGEQVE